MTKRRNPFLGVPRVTDRHGRTRWRFRGGLVDCYLPGEFGSVEFVAAHEAARQGKRPDGKPTHRSDPHGSFGWVIERYKGSGKLQQMAPITRRNLTLEIERFRVDHGHRIVTEMRPVHVERMMAKKVATPAAANRLLKLIRRLARYSIRLELIQTDATAGVAPYKTNPDGYHTWSDAEISRFRRQHGAGTKARLALELLLATGASRQDAARLGWQNVKEGRSAFKRGKTRQAVDLPIQPELWAELDQIAPDQMLFLTHGEGLPYKSESLGNWFREQCDAACLTGCSAHGLRKSGATRLANAGATENEIAAFLGHRTTNEARTYTKAADRGRLADGAFAKLQAADAAKTMSNPVGRLDNSGHKPQKQKGK
jgi:integrase